MFYKRVPIVLWGTRWDIVDVKSGDKLGHVILKKRQIKVTKKG